MRLAVLIASALVLASCIHVPREGVTEEVKALYEISRSIDTLTIWVVLGLLFGGFK